MGFVFGFFIFAIICMIFITIADKDLRDNWYAILLSFMLGLFICLSYDSYCDEMYAKRVGVSTNFASAVDTLAVDECTCLEDVVDVVYYAELYNIPLKEALMKHFNFTEEQAESIIILYYN